MYQRLKSSGTICIMRCSDWSCHRSLVRSSCKADLYALFESHFLLGRHQR
jgi:hypothetical protein